MWQKISVVSLWKFKGLLFSLAGRGFVFFVKVKFRFFPPFSCGLWKLNVLCSALPEEALCCVFFWVSSAYYSLFSVSSAVCKLPSAAAVRPAAVRTPWHGENSSSRSCGQGVLSQLHQHQGTLHACLHPNGWCKIVLCILRWPTVDWMLNSANYLTPCFLLLCMPTWCGGVGDGGWRGGRGEPVWPSSKVLGW